MPYSTLIALTNEIRETPVDDLDEDDVEENDVEHSSNDVEKHHNVVICDTQVILRINPDEEESETRNTEFKKESKLSRFGVNKKRMTRRLMTDSEAFSQTEVPSTTSGAMPTPSALPKLPKRKDLCRLLGLNEQDVDLMIVPEVKVAQKVALSHVAADPVTSQVASQSENGSTYCKQRNTAKKKDLAKFLGVDETQPTPQAIGSVKGSSSHQLNNHNYHSRKDHSPRPKSFLINWGQMVKSSVKGWKFDENNYGSDGIEQDVPVQLRQSSAKEPERTNRKDLSKFLGFDDSDSEEIVFIRNANPSINDSSLTRKSSSFDDDILNEASEDSDDSVGSLRSFDSFVRRSLRCGASSEFAIQIEEGANFLNNNSPNSILHAPKRGEILDQPNHRSSSNGYQQTRRRLRKKDAEKRSQEVLSKPASAAMTSADSISVAGAGSSAGAPSNLVTLDRKPGQAQNSGNNTHTSRILPRTAKEKQRVVFGPNSRRMISPVRSKKRQQIQHNENNMPPVFLREEPLFVYPQKPALFYQHYPLYASYGILPPGGRMSNNGRVRFPRHGHAKRPQMNS